MKAIFITILLAAPLLVTAQNTDSLQVIKRVDKLLQQLRPLIEQQKLDAALDTLNLADKILETTFGKGHPAFATTIAFRGKIAQRAEKYRDAEALYREAMKRQEKLTGKESPQYVISMSTLSTIYLMMGEYDKAEPLLMQTLAVRTKLVGTEHPDYARTLTNLGSLNFGRGHYGESEMYYLNALGIYENSIGKKHQEYAKTLANLSSVYAETGNFTKAEPLMHEVLAINTDTYGNKHPYYVKSVINLATLYDRMGEEGKAEALLIEAKDVFTNTLGKESSDYLLAVDNLASIYIRRGDYARAEPLLLEAQDLCLKVFDKKNRIYANTLKDIGKLYTMKGDYVRAEAALTEAYELYRTILGKDHPNTAFASTFLALLYQKTGRENEAAARFLEWGDINRHNVENAAGYSSEPEMSDYISTLQQYGSWFHSFAQDHPRPDMAGAAYDYALFYKGFLLNASRQVKNRASADTATVKQYESLCSYRHQLTEQYALPLSARDTITIAAMEEKANTLEKELARRVLGYSDALRQVNWPAVEAALQPREVAIEFIHYQYEKNGLPTDSTMYAAVLLRSGNESPALVPLFEERALITLFQGASGSNYRKINALYQAGNAPNALYELLWKKLENELEGATKVYCSLSGLLHRINPGAIPVSATQTFADRYQLVLLGSTRQLVINEPAVKYGSEALLVGGVSYAENDAAIDKANRRLSRSAGASRGMPDLETPLFETDSTSRSTVWDFLPSSVDEVLGLRRILQASKLQVKLDTGYAATEEAIKEYGNLAGKRSPRVLHFATHGYFFPDPAKMAAARARQEIAFKSSKNPLLRSGLILAGAQEVWSGGKPPAGREDGVLTALEISLMNLSGTELVVLSACETGLGDITGEEGVYGLQRAFKIAGAKYIVMSLWKVNDQTTSEFMTDFYTQWLKKGLSIPEAFRKAQQDMREKYLGAAYHWAGFELVE